jgi:hypothetical protein
MDIKLDKIATWLFLIGVALAVIFGIAMPDVGYIAAILALIGIIVGFTNITAAESEKFLIAAIALVISANSFALVPMLGSMLVNILKYLVALVAPAAVIVALILIWKLAKTK